MSDCSDTRETSGAFSRLCDLVRKTGLFRDSLSDSSVTSDFSRVYYHIIKYLSWPTFHLEISLFFTQAWLCMTSRNGKRNLSSGYLMICLRHHSRNFITDKQVVFASFSASLKLEAISNIAATESFLPLYSRCTSKRLVARQSP